jgi:hypothetical protein
MYRDDRAGTHRARRYDHTEVRHLRRTLSS